MNWSNRYVRVTQAQVARFPKGKESAICSPRAPAKRRAYGSRKSASRRSVSRARYTAAQCAVSEMFRIREPLWLTGQPPRKIAEPKRGRHLTASCRLRAIPFAMPASGLSSRRAKPAIRKQSLRQGGEEEPPRAE